MSLSPNTTLAHYTIIAKIGAGGMGEVYRARDSRLDGEVAIKVLPSNFANDAERLKRFEMEARATQLPPDRVSRPKAYVALGEKDKAFAELNKAYENRISSLDYLKVEP